MWPPHHLTHFSISSAQYAVACANKIGVGAANCDREEELEFHETPVTS
jgi:hypothetical protein